MRVVDEDESIPHFGEIRNAVETKMWMASVIIKTKEGATEVKFKIDSGADVTAIPRNMLKIIKIKEENLQPPNANLVSPDRSIVLESLRRNCTGNLS